MFTQTLPQPGRRLASLSAEHPSGPSLEYDPVFVAMERAASGREEQQFGPTVIDAEPPQWMAVEKLATELLERTHDLRLGVYLAESVIESQGLTGFSNCLEMLADWLLHEWETVHPQLDADDDFDPTLRANILTRLTDSQRVLERLRRIPLTDTRGLGTVLFGDLIAIAESSSADQEVVKLTEAALSGGPTEPLTAAATSLREAMAAVSRLDQALCERIGVAKSVEFAPLNKILRMPLGVLADRLERRGIHLDRAPSFGRAKPPTYAAYSSPAKAAAKEPSPFTALPIVVDSSPLDRVAASSPSIAGVSPRDWQISSRDDVTAALDRLCAYFAQYEPSSPIPMLLARAKRLVPMTFLEVLQELGPDVLAQTLRFQGETRP